MTIKELQSKWEGKTYAENAQFWFQCVSRAKKAIRELYWITLWSFWWSAHNWFITWSPFTAPWWTKFVNTPDKFPVPWSVIFRSKSWQLPYGHVAIVISADANNITVQEQNAKTGNGQWIGGDAITTRTHDYRWVSWWYSHIKMYEVQEIDEDIQALIDAWIFNGEYEPMDNKRLIKIIAKLYNKVK